MSETKIPFDKQIFGKNGYYDRLMHGGNLEELKKGATMTGLTYVSSTTWFDAVYGAELELQGLTRDTTLFKLLRKTSYQSEGDSYQVIAADTTDAASILNIGESGVVFGTETTVPGLTDVDTIVPAVLTAQWEDTVMARELSKIQRNRPTMTPDQLKQYFSLRFLDAIDRQLAGVFNVPATVHGADSPATNGTYAQFESIDRIVCGSTESLDAATYFSAGTDGDINWNNTGLGVNRVDRSAATTWDAQLRLPIAAGGTAAAGCAYNILDELDDLMAAAKVYARQPYNYIGLCSPKAMNKIQNEIDPKQRFLEGPADVTQTINGVSTRPGVEGGKVSVSSLQICGVQVPFFESPYLMGTATSSWKWLNVAHSTGGVGNIYLLNMDAIEFRTLVPITYVTWPNYSESDAPGLGNRHMLYMMGQLIAKNWQSHAALKYIAL